MMNELSGVAITTAPAWIFAVAVFGFRFRVRGAPWGLDRSDEVSVLLWCFLWTGFGNISGRVTAAYLGDDPRTATAVLTEWAPGIAILFVVLVLLSLGRWLGVPRDPRGLRLHFTTVVALLTVLLDLALVLASIGWRSA